MRSSCAAKGGLVQGPKALVSIPEKLILHGIKNGLLALWGVCAMWDFIRYLLGRAGAEILAAKGTTMLGGVLLPLAFGFIRFVTKSVRAGKLSFNKEDAIADGVATVLIWILLCSTYLFWIVPGEIRDEASRQNLVIRIPTILPPEMWDEAYLARKNHMRQETISDSNGWITEDHETRIKETLLSRSASKCQVDSAVEGDIDPRQLEPIKRAFVHAGWPPVLTKVQLPLPRVAIVGAIYNHFDRLSVLYVGSEKCAKTVCDALSVKCQPLWNDLTVPQTFKLRFKGVLIVVRQ